MTLAAPEFAAVILAAGSSSRMGTPKALLDAGTDTTFLDRLAGVFLDCGCAVYAVLGGDAERIAASARRASEIVFILNPNPARGQISSLQCGLRAAARGAKGVFFTPVDAPGIERDTVLALKNAFGESDYVVPVFHGKRGHPVLLRASCAEEFLSLPEGATARDLLQARRSATCQVEVPDSAILDDIDDPVAYEKWRTKASPRTKSPREDADSDASGERLPR
ncbi:MAG: nucleotidyltransferase family protein [Bryobacteraceae bacterium]